jgi:hypothetical protein
MGEDQSKVLTAITRAEAKALGLAALLDEQGVSEGPVAELLQPISA